MSLYWTIGIIAFVIFFAIGETYAFKRGGTTLSRYVVNADKAWPLLRFVLGFLCGGLAVHFFWPWCPELGLGTG